MKFRDKGTGEVKHLMIERVKLVSLTDVDNWFETYQLGVDDKLLELIEATPQERRALRRAGFAIKVAKGPQTLAQNAASRRRAKRARAIQKARQSRIATSSTEAAATPTEMHKAA